MIERLFGKGAIVTSETEIGWARITKGIGSQSLSDLDVSAAPR